MPALTPTKPPQQRANRRAKAASPRADRLPRAGAPVRRGHEIQVGLLGVVGILLLVIGVPVALILFVGYPLPSSAPSRDWLTTSITATLLIKALACVVWLVWAHFTVCIIAEWRALRRGRLPGSIPMGGGSQFLARRLVAAALMLAGAATIIPHGGAASFRSSAAPPPKAASSVAAQHVTQTATTTAQQPASRVNGVDVKYYVVAPPNGQRYDCLWDIAQRTLGNPLRYNEIFELNKGRVQADGGTLVDANLIRPGWQLILPADATGPGVVDMQSAPPPAAVTAPAATPSAANVGASKVLIHQDHPAPTSVRGPGGVAHASQAPATGIDSTSLAVGGGLLLAGLALAVSTRRGPYVGPSDDEDRLGKPADLGLAKLLDRELRRLAAWRAAQGRALPQPLLAYVSTERIVLQLAGGDQADPPVPWQLTDDNRSWTLTPDPAAPAAPEMSAPFPGLVSVGRSHGFELFVDLEQAPGVISVGGDVERAREIVTAMAVQAATSVWSDGVRVSLIGFADGADLAEIAPHLITADSDLGPVLAAAEADSAHAADLQRQLGVDGVLGGRQLRRDDVWRPHVIVLSAPPSADEAIRLQRLAGSGRSNFIAITVGDSHEARWRFAVDKSGELGLGVLGATARAHLLNRATSVAVVEMLRSATAIKRTEDATVRGLRPGETAGGIHPALPVPDVAALALPGGVSVLVLGPVQVEAPGPIEAGRRDLATEVVVAAALNRDGLHDAVLRASVWPRGVGDDVVDAAIADVQVWLGSAADGQPRLQREEDGMWRLAADVRTDWDLLRALAVRASGPSELATLCQAIELVRGEAFSATPAGRYGWLAFGRAARDARVLVTTVVRRAAELMMARHDAAGAMSALRWGIAFVPTSELVWRDLLTLAGRDGPEGGAAAASDMYAALARHRVRPEPETDALVAQIAPGYHEQRTA